VDKVFELSSNYFESMISSTSYSGSCSTESGEEEGVVGFQSAGVCRGEEDFVEYGPYGFPCAREFEFICCRADFR